jgi:hypothetical protein
MMDVSTTVSAALTNQRGYMLIPNLNNYIDILLYGVAVIGIILLLLELLTLENPEAPMQECKKWKEDDDDEHFYIDNPPK